MATEVVKRLINVGEYYRMAEVGILKPEDRVELIHGEIYKMTPIGSRHAGIVNKLSRLLHDLFKDRAITAVQNPISIDAHNEPMPDIALLEFKPDYYSTTHPVPEEVLLIIEVSGASIKFNREVKKVLYASSGIRLYWIIDLDNNQIEAFEAPKADNFSKFKIYSMDEDIPLLNKTLKVKEFLLAP